MTYTVAGVQRDLLASIEFQRENFIGQLPREILFHLINIINNSENQTGLTFFSWTCTGAYILRNLFFLSYEADKSKLFSDLCTEYTLDWRIQHLSSNQADCLLANIRSSYATSLFLNETFFNIIPKELLYQDETWRIFGGTDSTFAIIKKRETIPRSISFSLVDLLDQKKGGIYIAKGLFFCWCEGIFRNTRLNTRLLVVNLESPHPRDCFDWSFPQSIMHAWVDFNYQVIESTMVLNVLMGEPEGKIWMHSFHRPAKKVVKLQKMRGLQLRPVQKIPALAQISSSVMHASAKQLQEPAQRVSKDSVATNQVDNPSQRDEGLEQLNTLASSEAANHIFDDEIIRCLDATLERIGERTRRLEVVVQGLAEEISASAGIPSSVINDSARQLQEPARTNSIDNSGQRNEGLEQFNILASRVELIEVENRPPSTGKVILIVGVVFLALVIVATEVLLILQPGRVVYQGNGIILTLPMILTLSMGGSIGLATIAIGSYRWWKTGR